MRIKLIMVLALALIGFKATADDHARPFTVFIGISTDNPAAVVGAWDTFMASDCGKSHPGQVSIMNEFKLLSDKIGASWDDALNGFASDGRIGNLKASIISP